MHRDMTLSEIFATAAAGWPSDHMEMRDCMYLSFTGSVLASVQVFFNYTWNLVSFARKNISLSWSRQHFTAIQIMNGVCTCN